jgi:hypothetical protein
VCFCSHLECNTLRRYTYRSTKYMDNMLDWRVTWRGTVGEALRFKQEDHGFDSRWCHWYFSLTYSFWPYNGPRGDSASNMNIYWEVKTAGLWGWQTYHLRVPTVFKSVIFKLLEHSGPVQACTGTALSFPSASRFFSKSFTICLVHFLTCKGSNCRTIYFLVLLTFSQGHVPKFVV